MIGYVTIKQELQKVYPDYELEVGEAKAEHNWRTITVYHVLKTVCVEYWYWPPYTLMSIWKQDGLEHRLTKLDKSSLN